MSEEVNVEIQMEDDVSDADFNAGFDGTTGPTATPDTDELVSLAEENISDEQQQEPPKYRQITEDEWNGLKSDAAAINEMRATLGKQVDTAFGRIGGLERVLKQFQDQTPSGQAVEITEADFAELGEVFPELVGPQLAALKRVAERMKGTGNSTELDENRVRQAVDPMLSQFGNGVVERVKTEMVIETLDETHEGWRDVVGLPSEEGKFPDTEYRRWLETQAQEYQTRILESFSPTVIGRSIDKFNEHKKSIQKDSERRNRFDQAVTPRGDGGYTPPPDTDDDFMAGFNGR